MFLPHRCLTCRFSDVSYDGNGYPIFGCNASGEFAPFVENKSLCAGEEYEEADCPGLKVCVACRHLEYIEGVRPPLWIYRFPPTYRCKKLDISLQGDKICPCRGKDFELNTDMLASKGNPHE